MFDIRKFRDKYVRNSKPKIQVFISEKDTYVVLLRLSTSFSNKTIEIYQWTIAFQKNQGNPRNRNRKKRILVIYFLYDLKKI